MIFRLRLHGRGNIRIAGVWSCPGMQNKTPTGKSYEYRVFECQSFQRTLTLNPMETNKLQCLDFGVPEAENDWPHTGTAKKNREVFGILSYILAFVTCCCFGNAKTETFRLVSVRLRFVSFLFN